MDKPAWALGLPMGLPLGMPQVRSQRTLVGMVRATGDASLVRSLCHVIFSPVAPPLCQLTNCTFFDVVVHPLHSYPQTATLFDVAVHPSLHGMGIGRRMVSTIVHQLHAMGIYDIGAVSVDEDLG